LTVDVGNTNIAFGGFEGERLVFVARIATQGNKTADEYASTMLNLLLIHGVARGSITGAMISSVVPPLTAVMRDAVRLLCGVKALTVGPGIKTGLIIQCDAPSSVGADLIAASVAALRLYGAPALIVDMGTATKMMVLDSRGAFIGASIMAGVSMGLGALAASTAQLPQIGLEAPLHAVGKNTVDCMRSGAIFGNAAMIDGMIDRITEELGEPLPVIGTGGSASVILPHCRHAITMDEELVLKGLRILYEKNT